MTTSAHGGASSGTYATRKRAHLPAETLAGWQVAVFPAFPLYAYMYARAYVRAQSAGTGGNLSPATRTPRQRDDHG